MSDLNERVSIVEVKLENMDETLKRLHSNLESNTSLTLQIKERLDKQNGAIPHMAETMKLVLDEQKNLSSKLAEKAVDDAKASVKVKVMWGIILALGGGFLTFAIDLLKGFVQN